MVQCVCFTVLGLCRTPRGWQREIVLLHPDTSALWAYAFGVSVITMTKIVNVMRSTPLLAKMCLLSLYLRLKSGPVIQWMTFSEIRLLL